MHWATSPVTVYGCPSMVRIRRGDDLTGCAVRDQGPEELRRGGRVAALQLQGHGELVGCPPLAAEVEGLQDERDVEVPGGDVSGRDGDAEAERSGPSGGRVVEHVLRGEESVPLVIWSAPSHAWPRPGPFCVTRTETLRVPDAPSHPARSAAIRPVATGWTCAGAGPGFAGHTREPPVHRAVYGPGRSGKRPSPASEPEASVMVGVIVVVESAGTSHTMTVWELRHGSPRSRSRRSRPGCRACRRGRSRSGRRSRRSRRGRSPARTRSTVPSAAVSQSWRRSRSGWATPAGQVVTVPVGV